MFFAWSMTFSIPELMVPQLMGIFANALRPPLSSGMTSFVNENVAAFLNLKRGKKKRG